MSRGPGRWQRALLSALDGYDIAPVNAVVHNTLGRTPTRSEAVAARRAAALLAQQGQVRAIYLGECRRCGELSSRWDCTKCGSGCARCWP